MTWEPWFLPGLEETKWAGRGQSENVAGKLGEQLQEAETVKPVTAVGVADVAVVMTVFWQILEAVFLHFLCSFHQGLFYSSSVRSTGDYSCPFCF